MLMNKVANKNTTYMYFILLLSAILPISFILMHQEHFLVYSFLSVNHLSETLNLMMMGLSGWVAALMLLTSYKYSFTSSDFSLNNSKGLTLFTSSVLAVALSSIMFFSTNHMVFFYLFFEASMFPTLILIMKWGYQPERLQASFYFLMYTVSGSLPLLIFILSYMGMSQSQYFSFEGFGLIHAKAATNFVLISSTLAFLVKVPMWGLHLWLPKAHVEAPVSGSMVLAGILLKLGGYGIIKMYMTTLTLGSDLNKFVIAISIWSTVTVSLICLRQTDMKIIIAYSSVIHMGMMTMGLMSGSVVGFTGAIMMMIIHGLSSPAMFALANFNYESTGTRNLLLQKGFHMLQPMISFLWFIMIACNMAAPPFISLASEILIVTSIMKMGFWLALLGGISTLLSLTYNLFLFSSQQGTLTSVISHLYSCRKHYLLVLMLFLAPSLISVTGAYLYVL